MKRIWGPLGAAALLALNLTACGGTNAYNRNGTLSESSRNVTESNGKLTDNRGVTDFGDTRERSLTERASDALEDGVQRARDGLDMNNGNNRANNP